jgi:hypothetical protein
LVRCAAIPLLRARTVCLYPPAELIENAEVELGICLTLLGRLEIESGGLDVVHGDTEALIVGVADPELALGIALRGGGTEPVKRFGVVHRNAVAVAVAKGQVYLGADEALLGGRAHEGLATGGVDRPAVTVEVELSQTVLRSRIALIRGLLEPLPGLREVPALDEPPRVVGADLALSLRVTTLGERQRCSDVFGKGLRYLREDRPAPSRQRGDEDQACGEAGHWPPIQIRTPGRRDPARGGRGAPSTAAGTGR